MTSYGRWYASIANLALERSTWPKLVEALEVALAGECFPEHAGTLRAELAYWRGEIAEPGTGPKAATGWATP